MELPVEGGGLQWISDARDPIDRVVLEARGLRERTGDTQNPAGGVNESASGLAQWVSEADQVGTIVPKLCRITERIGN